MAAIPPPGYFRLFNSYRALLEVVLLIAAAFFFCFACGQRGIFPLDQSIVWDGGYRILIGQQPFRDFLFPHSLLLLYIQALCFKLFGISYYSYVLPAALMNAVAVVLSIRIVALLYPSARIPALVAGLLTGIWFLPSFGTPYGEHAAFLCSLLAMDLLLTALLGATEESPSGNGRRLFLAGICAGLAFYCKQNIAVFVWPFLLLSPGIAWFPDSRRCFVSVRIIVAGMLCALLIPAVVIAAQGNWRSFLYFYLLLPLATATRRMGGETSGVLSPQSWALWAAVGVVVASAIFSIRRTLHAGWLRLWDARSRYLPDALATWIAFYILLLSYVVRRSMLNNPTIADVYVGLLFGLSLALVAGKVPLGLRSGFARCLIGFALLTGLFGVYVALERKVQESVDGASFGESLPISGLEGLRWGHPTRIGEPGQESEVTEQDLREIVKVLAHDGRNFFVFPDFGFLYASLGVPSPQPLLFFHRGLTYPEEYDRDIDNLVVDTLIANQVALVVIEEKSFFGTQKRLKDFPVLEAFIHSNFNEAKKIGIFSVLTLKTIDEVPEVEGEAE